MLPNIDEILEKGKDINHPLPKGHRDRFKQKLESRSSTQNKPTRRLSWQMAASIAILVAVSALYFSPLSSSFSSQGDNSEESISLEVLSPELYSLESYYVNAINYEIANLTTDEKQEKLVAKYFEKMHRLDKQYQILVKNLLEEEVSEETINAIIGNLQLRLEMMLELKEKLKNGSQTKSKNHEEHSI